MNLRLVTVTSVTYWLTGPTRVGPHLCLFIPCRFPTNHRYTRICQSAVTVTQPTNSIHSLRLVSVPIYRGDHLLSCSAEVLESVFLSDSDWRLVLSTTRHSWYRPRHRHGQRLRYNSTQTWVRSLLWPLRQTALAWFLYGRPTVWERRLVSHLPGLSVTNCMFYSCRAWIRTRHSYNRIAAWI